MRARAHTHTHKSMLVMGTAWETRKRRHMFNPDMFTAVNMDMLVRWGRAF